MAPDADGSFRGISVSAEAWERVFGDRMAAHDHDWPECSCPPLHTDDQLRSCRCGCHD